MTVSEVLGWVTSLMGMLGIMVFVSAFLIILLVLAVIDRLFGHKN